MLIKKVIILFVCGLLFNSCKGQSNELSKTAERESKKVQSVSQASAKLPKEILILIGRGGSNYGHIISVNKNGYVQYGVGSYFIKTDGSRDMSETFNPELMKYDEKYPKKQKQLSAENITKLAELISDEEKLQQFDKMGSVLDDYDYNVYLDKKNIAFGYESNMSAFPKNLRSLINLILDEIEIHDLPGMA